MDDRNFNFFKILETVEISGASDIHLQAGTPPAIRLNGQLRFIDSLPPRLSDINAIMECMNIKPEYLGRLKDEKSTDFKFTTGSITSKTRISRKSYRVNIASTSDGYKITMRNLNKKVPQLNTLGHDPRAFSELFKMPHGLAIISGSTNSGKSTTLASLMQEFAKGKIYKTNDNTNAKIYGNNIITLEDPIEYQFDYSRSFVTRRELGVDFFDYPTAIHDAMREDPDIILVGEMRDAPTIKAAILAAETGHLVLASLHSNTIADCKERILLTFEPAERQLIEVAFSKCLRFMMSQSLVYDSKDDKLHMHSNYNYY